MQIPVFPSRLTVETTNCCNLTCSFCPRHHINMQEGYMNEKLFRKILAETSHYLPAAMVLFFRGEPLLDERLADFITLAKQTGVKSVQISTNAVNLTPQWTKKLVQAGLDFISFSLDSTNKINYKKYRHYELEKVSENVIYFSDYCQYLKKQGKTVPQIQISSVNNSDYEKDKNLFVQFWKKRADRVRIYQEHSQNGILGSLTKQVNTSLSARKPCSKVFNETVILYDGQLAICNHDWNGEYSIGTIATTDIKNLWNSENYEKLRKRHLDNQLKKSELCNKCQHWPMYCKDKQLIGELYCK